MKLETDNISQAQLLWACILLHNFWTETVQRNQILTYFDNLCNNDHGDEETDDVEEKDDKEEWNWRYGIYFTMTIWKITFLTKNIIES